MIAKRLKSLFLFSILLIPLVSRGEVYVYSRSYGESYLGKPLMAYQVIDEDFSRKDINKVLFISEGVHGNEYLGLTKKLLEEKFWNNLRSNHPLKAFLKTAGSIFITPQVNPDGITRKSRTTYDGTDLNRDFIDSKLSQLESFYLVEFIKDEIANLKVKYRISVDLHCCGGKLLQAQSSQISKSIPFITVLRNTESFKVPIQYTHEHFQESFQGTLKDYLNQKFNFHSFTFENFEMENPLREIETLLENLPFLMI